MSVCDEYGNPHSPFTEDAGSFLLDSAFVRRQPNRDPGARQKALVALGRRAIDPPKLEVLLHDAMALLAEMLKTEMIFLAELAPDGQTLNCRMTRLAASEAESQCWNSTETLSGSESLAGFVLQSIRPLVVIDLSHEDRFADPYLRGHRVLSAVAAPLNVGEVAFGVLAACSDLPAKFDDEDMLFVESVAQLIAASIARARAERRLAEERRVTSDLLNNVESLVLVLDQRGRILRINPACERVTEFSQAEISKRQFGDAFAVPKEADSIAAAICQCAAGHPVELEARLMTRQGKIRNVAWKFTPIGQKGGGIIMASGIDVTRERALESLVQKQRDVEAEAAAKVAEATAFPVERRRRPRRAFPYRQKIGYIFDDEMPDKSQFVEVMCHDIGPGGFSYLSHRPPESPMVVVVLGTAPSLTCMTAQIVHYRRMNFEGKWVYLVGCSYTGRAVY